MDQPLPDIIRPGMKVIFIGYNPSLRSAEMGHHYAGRGNKFWEVLFQSGLTPLKLNYLEDQDLRKYGFGSANIIDRPTKAADELTVDEYREGRVRLSEKLERYRPEIACYVGIGVYKAFARKNKAAWGLQTDQTVAGIIDFVAPSTSGLNRMPLADQVKIYRELTKLLGQHDLHN